MVEAASLAALGTRLIEDHALRHAAGEFLAAAAREGIRAAPIKGLVVSALLYEDPLERRFGDVDVLLTRSDLGRLEALAQHEGWSVVHDSKNLWALNVVLPPGLPIDARATMGPPLFARLTAEDVLGRARLERNTRVAPEPFWLLDGHDHLLLLLVDALLDKLYFRAPSRRVDLHRAVERWVTSPGEFASDARAAGLGIAAWAVLSWLERDGSGAPDLSAVRAALEPHNSVAQRLARRVVGELERDPSSWPSRIGVRLLADQPARGAAALALGVVGTARFHLRHRGRNPWASRIWKGP